MDPNLIKPGDLIIRKLEENSKYPKFTYTIISLVLKHDRDVETKYSFYRKKWMCGKYIKYNQESPKDWLDEHDII